MIDDSSSNIIRGPEGRWGTQRIDKGTMLKVSHHRLSQETRR